MSCRFFRCFQADDGRRNERNDGQGSVVDPGFVSMQERILEPVSIRPMDSGRGRTRGHLLSSMIPDGADPLGPDNVLAFMSGRLTGTGAVMTGRWMVCTPSRRLTGGWGDANCGGTLSPAIKRCGWDGILFKGVCGQSRALRHRQRGPRLEDASALWGSTRWKREERLVAAATAGNRKPAVGDDRPGGRAAIADLGHLQRRRPVRRALRRRCGHGLEATQGPRAVRIRQDSLRRPGRSKALSKALRGAR